MFDALGMLDDCVSKVVGARRDSGLRRWANWLREDLGSGPYTWLRPDFVPPSPFLVIRDEVAKTSQILVEPHLIDAEFRMAWMPFFYRSGHPVVTGQVLIDIAKAEKSAAGGLDGWAWNAGLSLIWWRLLLFGLRDCWMPTLL